MFLPSPREILYPLAVTQSPTPSRKQPLIWSALCFYKFVCCRHFTYMQTKCRLLWLVSFTWRVHLCSSVLKHPLVLPFFLLSNQISYTDIPCFTYPQVSWWILTVSIIKCDLVLGWVFILSFSKKQIKMTPLPFHCLLLALNPALYKFLERTSSLHHGCVLPWRESQRELLVPTVNS